MRFPCLQFHLHSILPSSGCIVKWVTERNRPVNIVNDVELINILTSGRPNVVIPSNSMVRRNMETTFARCREKVGKLLRVNPFYLSTFHTLTSIHVVRTIPVAFTLQLTLGRHQTIGRSLHGPFISSMKAICSCFYWTSSRCPRYVSSPNSFSYAYHDSRHSSLTQAWFLLMPFRKCWCVLA